MNNREAIQALLEGKKIRVKNWSSSSYIYFCEKGIIGENGRSEYFSFSNKNEWELYEEPKKKKKITFYEYIRSPYEDERYIEWCSNKDIGKDSDCQLTGNTREIEVED